MSYKTILAFLQSPADEDRVLDTAFPIASLFGAHLIGFHAEPDRAAIAAPAYYAQMNKQVELAERFEERMATMADRFRERAKREDVLCEWRSASTRSMDTSRAVIDSARCADLIVVGQPDGKGASKLSAEIERVIFESGRPVLFVPYAARIPARIDRVVVAWNATREAARATFDALPFIMGANEVEVFTVDPNGNDQTPALAGAEIASVLSRHGANVKTETQISDGIPVSAIIENRLADTQADLLVMGAYSHSRLSERLFGGVTRTVLESMPCITLMSR
ncbi:universal stress protein [Zhengella mangrovi]|uniref:Universal stress protein n=1 Tax=Zhengella mangrovi TaxID=1982044 RepID=A0A2G1QK38_9HYPH|nr:universal stress protein [Zhengella mangrovi]PHP65821.1 universal stress protein [Zhengella mangrovi]